MKRQIYFVTGWISFVAGCIGIFLPIVPTAPFMIASAACFSRSSPRFHHWLRSNKYVGQTICDWEDKRAIKKRSKQIALLVTTISFTISAIIVKPIGLKIMLVILAVVALIYISRIRVIDEHV